MPVKLRLKKQGRKKAPHYAIVAADSRAPRDGRYIEKFGFYNPIANPAQIYVDHETAIKWLKVGAQPTNTVRSILRHAGVTLKFALIKQGKEEDEMERIFNSWWEMKKSKKKKKFVQVDIHGKPLEEIPVIELVQHKAEAESQPEETESTETDAGSEEAAAPDAEASTKTVSESGSEAETAPASETESSTESEEPETEASTESEEPDNKEDKEAAKAS